jgi:hypothetical protein
VIEPPDGNQGFLSRQCRINHGGDGFFVWRFFLIAEHAPGGIKNPPAGGAGGKKRRCRTLSILSIGFISRDFRLRWAAPAAYTGAFFVGGEGWTREQDKAAKE